MSERIWHSSAKTALLILEIFWLRVRLAAFLGFGVLRHGLKYLDRLQSVRNGRIN